MAESIKSSSAASTATNVTLRNKKDSHITKDETIIKPAAGNYNFQFHLILPSKCFCMKSKALFKFYLVAIYLPARFDITTGKCHCKLIVLELNIESIPSAIVIKAEMSQHSENEKPKRKFRNVVKTIFDRNYYLI